jgi:hypothetical protein
VESQSKGQEWNIVGSLRGQWLAVGEVLGCHCWDVTLACLKEPVGRMVLECSNGVEAAH